MQAGTERAVVHRDEVDVVATSHTEADRPQHRLLGLTHRDIVCMDVYARAYTHVFSLHEKAGRPVLETVVWPCT